MQANDYTYFNDVLFQNLTETTDLNAAKQKLLSCLKELENEIKVCNEIDSIHTARKHVQAAVSIIKAMQNQKESVLPLKRKVSPNENHEKQRRFFSTKKKTVTATPSISKPSLQQSDQCKTKIRKTDPMFCGNCLKENDINHRNQTIQWIQCDTCSMWLHLSCTRPKLTSVPENYSCHFCCH